MPDEPLLRLDKVDTFYGKSQALRGVSLEVRSGEIVALLGLNGAGKTTTLRSIIGLTPSRAGTIHLCGKRIDGMPAYRVARLGVGYVPEGRRMFASLTAAENLELGERKGGDWSLSRVFERFPKLRELRARKAGKLSGGEQEMLAIGRALVGNPSLLLIDEPSQGLAPIVVGDLYRTLAELRAAGVAILLVEQNALLALKVAERAYVLDDGRIVYDGAGADLVRDRGRIATLMGLPSDELPVS
jgi:branched-chain amino acid transport system ATP-binding protein